MDTTGSNISKYPLRWIQYMIFSKYQVVFIMIKIRDEKMIQIRETKDVKFILRLFFNKRLN